MIYRHLIGSFSWDLDVFYGCRERETTYFSYKHKLLFIRFAQDDWSFLECWTSFIRLYCLFVRYCYDLEDVLQIHWDASLQHLLSMYLNDLSEKQQQNPSCELTHSSICFGITWNILEKVSLHVFVRRLFSWRFRIQEIKSSWNLKWMLWVKQIMKWSFQLFHIIAPLKQWYNQ